MEALERSQLYSEVKRLGAEKLYAQLEDQLDRVDEVIKRADDNGLPGTGPRKVRSKITEKMEFVLSYV
jgi:hypothetical protein